MLCLPLCTVEWNIFENTRRIFGAWCFAVHAFCVSFFLSCKVTEATCRLKVVVILLEGLSHITAFIAPVCEGTLVIFIILCHQLLDIMMQERRKAVIGVEYLFIFIASCFCSSLRPPVMGEA